MSLRLSSHQTELLKILVSPSGLRIVDIGCGDGSMTRHLAGLGAKVIGIETDMFQLARAHAAAEVDGACYAVGRGETLPFGAGEMDVVLYFNSLHHLPMFAMRAALEEAGRVLTPDGVLVVVEPLAEGPFFEALRPLDDETEVRAAALAAMRSVLTNLSQRQEMFYLNTLRFKDVEQFLAVAVAPDPARAIRLPDVEGELRSRFATCARQTPAGFEFDQPMRLNVFTRH